MILVDTCLLPKNYTDQLQKIKHGATTPNVWVLIPTLPKKRLHPKNADAIEKESEDYHHVK